MELAEDPQTILAYEMNGEPLPILHGAPLRLRVETQLGFTMVKYIRAIEFVEDYKTIGQGQGGWREDYQYFSQEAGVECCAPFCSGDANGSADRRDDLGLPNRFDVYYGMNDYRIGVARLDVPDFLPSEGVADPAEARV